MSRPHLVLFAHGSRDPRWRQTFESLVNLLRDNLWPAEVDLAYMEFARPTLDDVVASLAAEGKRQLRLLPMFLAGGAHMATDLPEQVAATREAFPHVEIEVLPPIGEDQRMAMLVLEIAREAAAPGPVASRIRASAPRALETGR